MPKPEHLRTIELTDPRALRAVAHPTRLTLLGLLRRDGPLTATQAAEHAGESPSSCSFHLRQLAKYGLVEEAPGGRGRERPWQATAFYTEWPNVASDPELAAAAQLFSAVIAERYFEQMMAWLETKAGDPPEWQEAALFGDTMLYLTADELTQFGKDIWKVVDRYTERTASPELRPAGSRLVTFIRLAFPRSQLHGGRER